MKTKSEVFFPLRVAAMLFLLFAILALLSGCATTASVDRTMVSGENCKSKVTGWFIAHGFTIPNACNPE